MPQERLCPALSRPLVPDSPQLILRHRPVLARQVSYEGIQLREPQLTHSSRLDHGTGQTGRFCYIQRRRMAEACLGARLFRHAAMMARGTT